MGARGEGYVRLSSVELDDRHPCFLHYRRLFSDLQKASAEAHGRLLDVGCGNKPYEEMFTGRVSEYVGCDVVQSSKHRVDVICEATQLPFADRSFDTVLCTQVIEHVADHMTLLAEIFRVLKTKGVLILTGPMYWPLHEEPYDFFRFTEHGFRHLLEKTGFTRIEITNNGGKWALCGQVLIQTLEGNRFCFGFIIRILNRIFAHLDDSRPERKNPMNYVVVATKT